MDNLIFADEVYAIQGAIYEVYKTLGAGFLVGASRPKNFSCISCISWLTMTHITTLGKLLNVLTFYKWAFGDLTEQDSDIGMLAEYLVGDILNCLPPTRKVQAPFDLIMKDGTTLEIKATTHKYDPKRGRTPYYRWDVSTQSEMLKGNRPIANYWVFLIATFPRETSRTPRVVQAFDLNNWKCYVVSGEKLRTAGCTKYVSESTLKRIEVEAFPLGGLKKRLNHEIH